MMTLVYVVTYRIDSKSPQCELDRYTKESADYFADGIISAGGVAIVTEDAREVDETNLSEAQQSHPNRNLQW